MIYGVRESKSVTQHNYSIRYSGVLKIGNEKGAELSPSLFFINSKTEKRFRG